MRWIEGKDELRRSKEKRLSLLTYFDVWKINPGLELLDSQDAIDIPRSDSHLETEGRSGWLILF